MQENSRSSYWRGASIGMNSRNLNAFVIMLSAIVSIALLYFFGAFDIAAIYTTKSPLRPVDRFADVTFLIWQRYDFSVHGFNVFLSEADFNSKIAYGGHTPFFAMLMWLLNCASNALNIPNKFLNVVFFIVANSAAIGVVGYKQLGNVAVNISFSRVLVLVSLLIGFFTTTVTFVAISKNNFDNPMLWIVPILILLAYDFGTGSFGKKITFSLSILFALISPITAIFFFLPVTLFILLSENSIFNRKIGKSIIFLIISIVFYLANNIWLKFFGFSSSASGWLFRSGLDGSTAYYLNHFQAILYPYYPRAISLIMVPIVWLVGFSIASKYQNPTHKSSGSFNSIEVVAISAPYFIFFSIFPQAVSIHPYLYDSYLILPFFYISYRIFLGSKYDLPIPTLLIIASSLVVVSFNLTRISQNAKCIDCYPEYKTDCDKSIQKVYPGFEPCKFIF